MTDEDDIIRERLADCIVEHKDRLLYTAFWKEMKQIMSNKSCMSSIVDGNTDAQTTLHAFNGPLSGTTRVSRYQKGKTNLDFTEARDSEWQWHQLGRMQIFCTSLQTDNHASTPPLSFLQAGCPSCRPTNSVKALKTLMLKV